MKSKKAITISFLILMLIFVYYAINAAPLMTDQNYTYLGNLRWYKTYEEGSKIAIELKKPMLVYFWTIWCTYCEKMQTEVFPQGEINKILKEDFVLIAVDMDVNKEDPRRFNVQYPPHELFLTSDGKVITRIPGYVSAEGFLPVLREIKQYGGNK